MAGRNSKDPAAGRAVDHASHLLLHGDGDAPATRFARDVARHDDIAAHRSWSDTNVVIATRESRVVRGWAGGNAAQRPAIVGNAARPSVVVGALSATDIHVVFAIADAVRDSVHDRRPSRSVPTHWAS
jgi:hypothetical protein